MVNPFTLARLGGFLKAVPTWLWVALGAFVLIWLYGNYQHDVGFKKADTQWQAKIARDKAAQAERERVATDQLGRQKLKDQAAATVRTQEIDNATRDIPDQAPSARQRARACLELRRQAPANGRHPPAC